MISRFAFSLVTLALVVCGLVSIPNEAFAEAVVVEVPAQSEGKAGKEVTVLLANDQLKLATIALRAGTALPMHSTAAPATIQVLEGEGLIHVNGEPVNVSKGSIVVLKAGEEHDVVPKSKTDMLLLVHYLLAAAPDSHDDNGHHH